MKILTFVIPAYNSEKFLDKCITSMLVPEALPELEILVVNDGSTDTTPEIAAGYESRYPGVVRLISQKNAGHGGALNTGCAAAQGKYLKVIDADDWILSENLVEFLALLKECDSDVVLTPHHTINISNGEVKNWRCYPKTFGKAYTFDDIMSEWKSFDRSLTLHGICYRTEFYHAWADRMPEKVFYEDHYYATYPCCYAKSITPFDLFIYEYRIGDCEQSVSNENQLKRLGHTQTVIQAMSEKYCTLPEGNGKCFAAHKVQDLLMSYLATALLVEPNHKKGRTEAQAIVDKCKKDTPDVYEGVKKKYTVFLMMNHLHLNKRHWDAILNTKIYNRLRNNHDFA
ncbi:glycosyltransferase family 2 protein [Gemmiger sp.]